MNNKTKTQIDVAIVGGGIIGLWSAYSILKKHPHLTLAVIEAEEYLGEHTTGRNSEVLHSGIYYSKNSLKHTHCMAGNILWREYIKKTNMPFLDCGKIVVAAEGQEEALNLLKEKAIANGVEIRNISLGELSNYKKDINLVDGFFVPSSGVLDVSSAIKFLTNDIETMGGIILKRSRAKLLSYSQENFKLDVNGDEIETSILINCAGLFALDFRSSLQLNDYSNFFVKGNYLKLKKNIQINKLVYPIPPSDGLGLGVHLTLDTVGGQKFGPNTEVVKEIDYKVNANLCEEMFPAIKQIFKKITIDDLQLGYAGIRPKIKKNNETVLDFTFNDSNSHKIKGYFEFLGIESPGLTSAPSLGLMLSELI